MRKVHAMVTSNVGTLTKNQTYVDHSDTEDAKVPKTTLPPKKLANTNARTQQFKKVFLHFLHGFVFYFGLVEGNLCHDLIIYYWRW